MTSLAACSTPTASSSSGRSSASNVLSGIESAAANLVLPVSQEVAVGRQVKAEFEQQNRLHQSRDLQAYVDRVGRAVAAKASLPAGMRPDFHVIDDDKTINAVTLPGGHIYVYSGMMKVMNDESELAGVLAHEVGHVANRHIAQRLAKAYGLQLLASVALGQNPGVVRQIATGLAANTAMLAFSRSDEREADFAGLTMTERAGYDPRGMVRVFQTLARQGGGRIEFLQSHPLPQSRVEYLADAIRKNRGGKTERAEYQAMKDEL